MKSASDDKTGRAMSVHSKPASLPRPSRSYTVAATASQQRRSPAFSTSGPRPHVNKEPIIVYFGDKTSIQIEIYATHSASAMKVIIFKAKNMPVGDIEKYGLYSEVVSNLHRKVSEVASDSKPFDLYKKYAGSTKSQLRFFLLEKSRYKDFKLNKFGKGWKKVKKAKKGKTMRKLRGLSKIDRSESSSLSPKKKNRSNARMRSNTTGSFGMKRESCPSTAERMGSPAHVTKDNESRGSTPTKNRPGSPTPARKIARDSGRIEAAKVHAAAVCNQCSEIIQNTQDKKLTIEAAKIITSETQKLIACAKDVSVLFLDFPLRQKQLLSHGRGVAVTTSKLAQKSQRADNDADLGELVSLAKVLSNHCEELLAVILSANSQLTQDPVPSLSVEVEIIEAPVVQTMSTAVDSGRTRAHTSITPSSNPISASKSFETRTKPSIESVNAPAREVKSLDVPEGDSDDVDALLAEFEAEVEQTKNLGINVSVSLDATAQEHAYLSPDEVDGIYAMITELETLTDTNAIADLEIKDDDFELKHQKVTPSTAVSVSVEKKVDPQPFESQATALEKLMDPAVSNSARLSVLMNAVEQDLQRETEEVDEVFEPVDEKAAMDENDAILAQFDALQIEVVDLAF